MGKWKNIFELGVVTRRGGGGIPPLRPGSVRAALHSCKDKAGTHKNKKHLVITCERSGLDLANIIVGEGAFVHNVGAKIKLRPAKRGTKDACGVRPSFTEAAGGRKANGIIQRQLTAPEDVEILAVDQEECAVLKSEPGKLEFRLPNSIAKELRKL